MAIIREFVAMDEDIYSHPAWHRRQGALETWVAEMKTYLKGCEQLALYRGKSDTSVSGEAPGQSLIILVIRNETTELTGYFTESDLAHRRTEQRPYSPTRKLSEEGVRKCLDGLRATLSGGKPT